MIYRKEEPSEHLSQFINCYWYIHGEEDSEVQTQKIIPDGYPEIILHFADTYEINITGKWKAQSQYLLAGQITNHFFLRNTGYTGMLGIKLQPTAVSELFGLDMSEMTNEVIALPDQVKTGLSPIINSLKEPTDKLFEVCDQTFSSLIAQVVTPSHATETVNMIIENKGLVNLQELSESANLGERQLERLFKKHVGLSPKFYSRVIRFAHIFELIEAGKTDWSDLVFESGFYDQSHFIKNFKEFTGEDPSSYGFDEDDMANFHLMK